MVNLKQYKKSIVAVIGAVVSILAINGVDVDDQLVIAITTLVTAAGVWFFPNG